MKSLKTFPPRRFLVAITLVALAATVVIWLAMRAPESQMQAAGGYGIVNYELAYNADKAETILRAWGSTGQAAARRSLLIDFAFMPAYGLLFAGITLLIARAQPGRLATVGRWLVLAPIAAALFDALENTMLLSMLGTAGRVPPLPPLVAGVSASVKFALLLLAILYWLVGGGAWLAGRRS
jgi:hypothetical protein